MTLFTNDTNHPNHASSKNCIRNTTGVVIRENESDGYTELWIDGAVRNRYISTGTKEEIFGYFMQCMYSMCKENL